MVQAVDKQRLLEAQDVGNHGLKFYPSAPSKVPKEK